MTLSTHLAEAEQDRLQISQIEQIMRDHLLAALSEARTFIFNDPKVRDALMDGLAKQFHPDGSARDLFSGAFTDARIMADAEIEARQDEFSLAANASVRDAAYAAHYASVSRDH